MTVVRLQDGSVITQAGAVGVAPECCCGSGGCCTVSFRVWAGICQAFGLEPEQSYTDEQMAESCADTQELFDWLAGAMQSLGYTVTQGNDTAECQQNICPSTSGFNTVPCYCAFELTGTATCCNHPAAGNVMDNPNWADIAALPGGDVWDLPGTNILFWEWTSTCTLIDPDHPPSVYGDTGLPGAYERPSFPYRGIGFYVPRCAGASCPESCPELGDCHLVVVVENIYGTYEAINAAASGFVVDEYENCQLAFTVTGVEPEDGGDITGLVTIGYGNNDCAPVVTAVTLTRADEGSCTGPCAPVFVYLECNPLP